MSSALKTTPAAAVDAVALTVSTAAFSSVCSASWIARAGPGVARERPGHHEQRHDGSGEDPQRHGGLPTCQPDRDGHREQEARDRLEEHEPAVEPEPAVA